MAFVIRQCIIATMMATAMAGCARDYGMSAAAAWKPGTSEHTVAVGRDDRTFLLHIPALQPRNRIGVTREFPLIIMLHGSGASGETIRRQSRIERLADSLHFMVAFPNGSRSLLGFGSDWNAGACCGNAARDGVDDVGFMRAVIAEVGGHVPMDRRRIYVAGFSDGARMSYRVACEMSAVVAAVGVASGSLTDAHCAPTRAVPLVAFHGTADSEVPYADSALTSTSAPMPAGTAGFPPAIRFWAAMNRCAGVVSHRDAPHVTRAVFRPCAGADVVFYSVDQGLHAWPGGEKDGSDGQEPTTELDATAVMVQFFLRHPRR